MESKDSGAPSSGAERPRRRGKRRQGEAVVVESAGLVVPSAEMEGPRAAALIGRLGELAATLARSQDAAAVAAEVERAVMELEPIEAATVHAAGNLEVRLVAGRTLSAAESAFVAAAGTQCVGALDRVRAGEDLHRRVTELAAALEQVGGDARDMFRLTRSVIAPPAWRVDLVERATADHLRAARALADALIAKAH